MNKAEFRQQLQKKLLSMSDEQRVEKSRRACHNLISTQQFQDASVIMAFVSFGHEIDTSNVILHAWQLGKTIVVPKISWQQRHMMPVKITSLETGFTTGDSGLRNPVTGVPIPVEEIGLVVTPAMGFDVKGNRLGRGGAFYDRFFASEGLKALRCGFGYAEQLLEEIPVTANDVPVDFLVTDAGVRYFNIDIGPQVQGE